jgi:Ca2+-binding RTX toxin-like protein
VLKGGLGNDIFIVDNAADTAMESSGEGTDTVMASVSYTLNSDVENLVLTGAAALNGTGTNKNNVLTGNEAANSLSGLDGDDALYGQGGADRLTGGTSNDILAGGTGIIQDYQASSNTDTLSFGPDISAEQIWFRHSGNDLEISLIGTQDSTTIKDWYSGSAYHVEQIVLGDGTVLLDTQVQALVDAMAAFAPPAEGQTTLPQNYRDILLGQIESNWTSSTGTSASAPGSGSTTSSTGAVSYFSDPSSGSTSGSDPVISLSGSSIRVTFTSSGFI